MKQRGLKFLSLLLMLVLLIGVLPGMSAFAETLAWPSFDTTVTYDTSTKILTVSGTDTGAMADYPNSTDVPWSQYRRSIQSVVINGGVTSIGRHAFDNCSSLTSVSIPSSVTSIDAYAFYNCTSLTSVVIPNGVTSIGECAFRNCTGLNGNLNIPGSVTSIGAQAFRGANFTSVTFEPGVNGKKLKIENLAFNSNSTTLAYGSGNAKLYDENDEEVAAGTKMSTLSNKTLTWKSTGFTVSFKPNGGSGTMEDVTVSGDYPLPECTFIPPDGMRFKAWSLADIEYAPGTSVNITHDTTFKAVWEDASGHDSDGGSGSFVDLVFNIPGADNSWEYVGGYAPQQAYRVSLAPMQGGSAALGLTTGDSGTALNVYPTSAVYVFPNADPGYTLDKIVWSLIDGSASYDITEAKNFVMPAMDVVVYVTFRPVA